MFGSVTGSARRPVSELPISHQKTKVSSSLNAVSTITVIPMAEWAESRTPTRSERIFLIIPLINGIISPNPHEECHAADHLQRVADAHPLKFLLHLRTHRNIVFVKLADNQRPRPVTTSFRYPLYSELPLSSAAFGVSFPPSPHSHREGPFR